MTKHFLSTPLFLVTVLLMASATTIDAYASSTHQEIEWTALIPEDDLDALLNPPEYLSDITDGSAQDSVEAFSNKNIEDEKTKRFQEALTSARVVERFDQQTIRIPGFIVPLQANNDRLVTEFFIVPYFGACLHMPPPPPNQIIYSASKDGIRVKDLYAPFWFEGTLSIDKTENDMGTSAYTLSLDNVTPYEE